jgi:dihydroneopterin aldolase
MTAPPPRASTMIFVRGLEVAAHIGVYAHEEGREQPLIIDADLTIETHGWARLSDTVNYERVGVHARAIAGAGHIGLVETFAHRLAVACLAEARVVRVRIRVEKPLALAPHASAAGVEIVLERAYDPGGAGEPR